jgi:peptide/nickel transport system permease protein
VRGELGRSIRTNQPVTEAILERLPVTLSLAAAASLLALAVALPAGIVSAVRRNSVADVAGTVVALSGVSLPNFWLAILLIFLFSVSLGWLPPLGWVSPARDFWAGLRSLVLPAITLGTAMAAVVMRMTRSSLLEVLQLEFVRTARAKGLGETAILLRHALRNALIPVVTVVGLQAGALLGGAIITETIFALPGVGRLLVDAIFQRDFPIIQGVVLFLAVNFLLVNLVVDLAYAALDPRIRYD